jgi:hypothetical protein
MVHLLVFNNERIFRMHGTTIKILSPIFMTLKKTFTETQIHHPAQNSCPVDIIMI